MASKWEVNQAVKASSLPPPRRLIMLVLSDAADPKTGIIPDDRTPALREIAEWTGLDKSTVTRHLDALDDDGWVIRDRPDRETARRDRVRTRYRLDVPRGAHNATGRGAEDTTVDPEKAPSVMQPAPSQDGQVGQDAPLETDERGAQNTTPVVHPAPTPVVHPAPVPYTNKVKNDKTPSTSANTTADTPIVPAPKRADVEQICTHLADRIEANGSLRPTITKRWRTEARLLLDKDGRAMEQVLKAIDWCQSDPFWRANIRSMPKLREKYDTLRLQAMRPNGRASPKPQLVEVNGLMLGERNQEAIARHERIKRLQAAKNADQTSIEGPRP